MSSFSKTYENELPVSYLLMLKNILLQFTDLYNMICVYCREEDKLFLCIKTTPSCIHKKKSNKTLLLRLVTYDLTSNFWIYFPSKVLSYIFWKTAEISKMLYKNVPLTVQQFKAKRSVIRVSWCSIFFQPIGSSFPFFRVFDFFLSFLNHRVFDKFIQFKSCINSST